MPHYHILLHIVYTVAMLVGGAYFGYTYGQAGQNKAMKELTKASSIVLAAEHAAKRKRK